MSTDRTLACRDCGRHFIWSAGEQDFYASKGLDRPPSRCKSCRDAKKAAGCTPIRSDRPLYAAVCSDCGAPIQLPFEPTPGKAVRCRDCHAAAKARYEERKANAPKMYEVTCDVCGCATRVPFEPTPGKKIRCRDCHAAFKAQGGDYWAQCCECGREVWLTFEPSPDKWVRCNDCHEEWKARKFSEHLGLRDGTSSRKTRDIMGGIVDKPDTYSLGHGIQMPIPRSYHISGIPGSFPKGGRKRSGFP